VSSTNILLALHAINTLGGLVADAVSAGRDISDDELREAMARADAADEAWRNQLPETGEDKS
jgi:hypothetical protein